MGRRKRAAETNAAVLVAGAGGSGSPLLYYLAAAGVGTIKICDGDKVSLDNLNRQILHGDKRIGINKAVSARKTLADFNKDIKIIAYPRYLDEKNIKELARDCGLICCAADERENRLAMKAINHYSFANRIPVVWAGGFYMGGFITFIQPPETPCMECLLARNDAAIEAIRKGLMAKKEDEFIPEKGPNPIVGAAAGIAGALQAMEAIKYLVGFGKNLKGNLLLFQTGDIINFNTHDMSAVRRADCPYCGNQ
jgi:adenylyltransferase/sulfurtransferase